MRNQNATNQKANKYLSLFYDRSLKGFIKLTYFNAENSRKGLRVVKEIAERLETELTGKIIKCPKSKLGNAFEREVLNLIEMNEAEEIVRAIRDQITSLFTEENLRNLRRYWLDGGLPDTGYLRRHKLLDHGSIFLDINTQYDYVGGWTTFAGVWYEEIEPWIKEKEANIER